MYDRMDRSEGTAFVTYEDPRDARDAVAEFNGQNANGQPIRLSILPTAPAPKGNLFDRVERPTRSLFDRIEGGPDSRDDSREDARRPRRRRSESPHRKMTPENIDRYVPGGRRPRSRSPPRRRGTPRGGGRRPGQTRDDRGGAARRGRTDEEGRPTAGGRPKKTAEELDAEMADYWGKSTEPTSVTNGSAATQNGTSYAAPSGPVDEDIDMIE